MAKKPSAWAKAVRIECIKRDWKLKDLAREIHKDHDYVIAVVNERVISEKARKDISDFLNIPYDADDSAYGL